LALEIIFICNAILFYVTNFLEQKCFRNLIFPHMFCKFLLLRSKHLPLSLFNVQNFPNSLRIRFREKYFSTFLKFLFINLKNINNEFYICSSVHRNSRLKKSKEIQQYAAIYLQLNYSTCFGRPSHSSLGVYKTVVAASGTDHTI